MMWSIMDTSEQMCTEQVFEMCEMWTGKRDLMITQISSSIHKWNRNVRRH